MNSSFLWIIMLLCCCGGFGGYDTKPGCDGGFGDIGCLLPILLLCSCGGFGTGFGQKCC